MATIRAAYRRTFQVAPYETETVELSVEDDILDGKVLVVEAEALYRSLAEVGDRVVVDRMTAAPVRRDAASLGNARVPRDQNPW